MSCWANSTSMYSARAFWNNFVAISTDSTNASYCFLRNSMLFR